MTRRDSPSARERGRVTLASTVAALVPRAGLDLDRARTGRRKDEGQAFLGLRLEPAEAQHSLLARRPQHGSREKGVLVLPVVPVRAGLHRVDGLGNEAVAHRREGDHPALAVCPRRHHRKPGRLDRDVALGLVTVEAAAPRAGRQDVQVEAVGDRVRPRAPLSLARSLPGSASG